MNRRCVAACTTAVALLLGVVIGTDASARTPSWLTVTTASKATAYNGRSVVVKPHATARGKRVISSLRVTVYRGKKRVAAGKSVRLKPGKYRTVTTGTYRSYKLVSRAGTRHHTRKVRSYGRKHRFSSTKRKLTVRDGGYHLEFTGVGSRVTSPFPSPGENWHIAYSFQCFHDFGTFAINVRRPGGEFVGGVSAVGSAGGGNIPQQGTGQFYLDLNMEEDCSWSISVT